jgi:hypothetical protein
VADAPSLNKDLLCAVGRASCRSRADVCGELLKRMIRTESHATESTCCVHRFLLIRGHRLWRGTEHGVVVGCGMVPEEHGDVVCLAGGRVDRIGVTGIGGCSCTSSADVALTEMVFEGGVGEVVVRRGLVLADELCLLDNRRKGPHT